MAVGGATELTRTQVLARRRRAGVLDRRLPGGAASIRQAAWAGLQDSVPRAAVLSLHARVEGTAPDDWAHPALVQIWGPRYSVFAVPAVDVAVFTLGRLPTEGAARRRAEETADRLDRFLSGRTMTYRAAGEGLGVHPNSLRYAAPTGRVRMRWDGAGPPIIWMMAPPDVPEHDARLELVRRYVGVFGPATVDGFVRWAGVKPTVAAATFAALDDELVVVGTPIGPAWMLRSDALTADQSSIDMPAPARLLPSGDAYFLRWGIDRLLLVADARQRDALWTSRVWPGAIMVHGEIVGTWRRSGFDVHLMPWRRLGESERHAVEAEAGALPLPGEHSDIEVHWSEP